MVPAQRMATRPKRVRCVARSSSGARNGSAIGISFATAQSGVNEVPKRSGALADMLMGVAFSNSAPVAQRIEHLTTDQKVGGSNPSGRASYFPLVIRVFSTALTPSKE